MKLLRILTGTHAGAQLQLAPGAHRIGTDDAADIRLTDWRGADLWLTVDDSGVVSAQAVASANAGAAAGNPTSGPLETILLIDFVPMQFDGTILCVGDETGVWPSDYELLQTLLAKPVPKASPLRRRYLGIAAACFGVGAVIVTVSVLSTVQMSRAALPPNADDNARRVTEALAAARIDGLNAHAVGDTVVVTGMLASSADDSAVRQLLRRLTITQVAPQYDVAPQVARSIEDSLGVPGARVQYGGGGRFVIKGSVGNKMALDAAIARVRADLDPNVKDIVADVSESASNATSTDATAYSEMISADGVQYAQTPDGVKHIYASDPQDASAADAAAAADNAANAAANGAADSGVTGANGTVSSNANTGVSAPAKVAATGTAASAQATPAAGKPARAGASRKDAAAKAANAPGAPAPRNTADEFVPLPSASAELPRAARTHAPMPASATRPAALAQRAEPPSRQPAPPIAG
ncbi:type III secretion protein [Burkholderia gladioli]|uniref:type III secretion protein n=1 Tax=Burkholderia gladioli TaxID=28095 RepID=UPI0016406B4B|nr:type III secretion protein [Burkholderia gladioli]